MKVITASERTLSNFELHLLLKDLASTSSATSALGSNITGLQDSLTVQYEAQQYLGAADSPCTLLSHSSFCHLLEFLESLPLRKDERLQIMNLLPTSHAALFVLVGEIEARLSEQQINAVIERTLQIKQPSQEQDISMETN